MYVQSISFSYFRKALSMFFMALAKHWCRSTTACLPLGSECCSPSLLRDRVLQVSLLTTTPSKGIQEVFLYINVQSHCSNSTSTSGLFVCCTLFLGCFYG